MLLKLAALGALGYVGYKAYEKSRTVPRVALAGGPLSRQARVQKDPDSPPQ